MDTVPVPATSSSSSLLAIPGIVPAGEVAAVLVVAAAYSYYGAVKLKHNWQAYKDKANLEKIDIVKILHAEKLTNLEVKDSSGRILELISLPEVFEGADGKEQKGCFLTDSMMEAFNDNDPVFSDARLLEYGYHINNAMLALRDFYLSRIKNRTGWQRGKDIDVTSSVLTYLILNVSTHCYKMDSHFRTMAYLTGIIEFIEGFASKHGDTADRFERLTIVRNHLLDAQVQLLQNSLELSYQTMFNEICPVMMAYTKKLLISCVKLVSPNSHWSFVDRIMTHYIAEGIIRPHFKFEHNGYFVNPAEITIPKSILKEWLMECAKHFILALHINDKPEEKGSYISSKKFEQELFDVKELKELEKVFANSENFLTRQQNPKPGQNKWVPVKGEAEIKKRVKVFAELMTLIDRLNSTIYFCAHMSNRVMQLGEIYISNPHHCVYLFDVLHGLGQQIGTLSKNLNENLLLVQKESRYMPLDNVSSVYKNLIKLISKINSSCVPAIKTLYHKHTKYPGIKDVIDKRQPEFEANQDVMLTIAEQIALEFDIVTQTKPIGLMHVDPDPAPVGLDSVRLMRHVRGAEQDIEEDEGVRTNRGRHFNFGVAPEQKASSGNPFEEDSDEADEGNINVMNSIAARQNVTSDADEDEAITPQTVDHKIIDVRRRILVIKRDERIESLEFIKLYLDIVKALEVLKAQADLPANKLKSANILELTYRLSQYTLNYFKKDHFERRVQVGYVNEMILDNLKPVKTPFLDNSRWTLFRHSVLRDCANTIKNLWGTMTQKIEEEVRVAPVVPPPAQQPPTIARTVSLARMSTMRLVRAPSVRIPIGVDEDENKEDQSQPGRRPGIGLSVTPPSS